jgi:UDP-N-acetylmuramoyl-tripeptide--D-alanyl-D-alanine ligase
MTEQEISGGLKTYHPIEKRWEVEQIKGLKFINDSYNANPESMKASVKAFIELYPNPVVVLGDMGELGENEIRYHRQVGEFLSGLNKYVKYILVGKLAHEIGKSLENKGFEVVYFDTNEQASVYIVENLNESNTIFLKASRSMKFEEILEKIKE